jgi:CheY-like chemotaxis protein
VRVLVVDDEPDIREFLADVLGDAGFEVATADDGDAALASIRERRPDLISLDLVMPRKSGIRLLHELRRSSDWSRIPVLIVSGHAHDEPIRADLASVLAESSLVSPASFLEKPVTPRSYLETVCRMVNVAAPTVGDEARAAALRREAEALLGAADAATLDEILAKLRGKGPAGNA